MPKKEDYTGRIIGPFLVYKPVNEEGSLYQNPKYKRHWAVICGHRHISCRRIDTLLKARPETLHCEDCDKYGLPPINPFVQKFGFVPAPPPAGLSYTHDQAPAATLNDETKAALSILTQSLGLALKALAEIARTTA